MATLGSKHFHTVSIPVLHSRHYIRATVKSINSLPCDIVLLPNDEQSKLAIEASNVLKPQGSLFTLDNQNFYAHASLYMFQMNEDSQEKCIAALQKIASRMSVQHLQEEGYYYQDSGHGKGYIDISFTRTEQVDHLQQVVVTTFNELRDDMRESDKNKWLTPPESSSRIYKSLAIPQLANSFDLISRLQGYQKKLNRT